MKILICRILGRNFVAEINEGSNVYHLYLQLFGWNTVQPNVHHWDNLSHLTSPNRIALGILHAIFHRRTQRFIYIVD